MTGDEFQQYVDAFMMANKALVGANDSPLWERGRDEGSQRLKLPISVDDEQRGESMIIDTFPDSDQLLFHIVIEVRGHAVSRLDFEPMGIHSNPLDVGNGKLLVHGPHVHEWQANKRRFTGGSKPVKIPYATPLPSQLRQFDATLRWYCTMHNIYLGAHSVNYPQKTRLI